MATLAATRYPCDRKVPKPVKHMNAPGTDDEPLRWRFGRFELRPTERLLMRDGESVRLGARAFDLLVALVERRNRLVTHSELLDVVWPGLVVENANVQVQISALRKVLGPDAVSTIPGLGYRFAMVADAAAPYAAPVEPHGVPRSHDGRYTNVPSAMEPLVGRAADVLTLVTLLESCRLVTVVGTGGVGKTQLALEAARRAMDRYPRGVWCVDLATLTSADQVVPAIAKSTGVSLSEGDAVPRVARALSGQRLLLILDNCEHLLKAVAEVTAALMSTGPAVRVLATSREALHLASEQIFRLAPLDVPSEVATVEEVRRSSAVLLLERRARAVDPRVGFPDESLAKAGALCRRLDGIPLALEMAAARLPMLGFQGLQGQLGLILEHLSNKTQNAPARHRSLRVTLDWSYSLLDEVEKSLLRRLSVFAGSFGLSTVRDAVGHEPLDSVVTLNALAGLVEKSLLKQVDFDPPRYRLLETTKLYAAERLEEAGETAEMHRRHGVAMAMLANCSQESLRAGSSGWLASDLAADYPDLELAFERAHARRDADVGASTVTALRKLDQSQGLFSSSGRRVDKACALLAHAGPRAQALLHGFIASCGWISLPGFPRLESALQAVALWRTLEDRRALHDALAMAATEVSRAGNHALADRMLDEARSIEGEDWPSRSVAYRLIHEGWVAQHRGSPLRCCDSLRAALAICERLGEEDMVNSVRLLLASAALAAGNVEEAGRMVARSGRRGVQEDGGYALSVLCQALLAAGDVAGARAAAGRVLRSEKLDDVHLLDVMRCVALLAASAGDPHTGALLMSHVERRRSPGSEPSDRVVEDLTHRAWSAIESTLTRDEIAGLRLLGERLDSEEVQRLARQAIGSRPDGCLQG
jgi:predicted ATPase/DNA-binding winged helix-turn-helix (wHTH) protein